MQVLGCSKDWAASSWTMRSLLERGDGEWMWKANFVDKSGMVNASSAQVTQVINHNKENKKEGETVKV